MKLLKVELPLVQHITANLRPADRLEAHATRWNDSDEDLATEIMAWAGGVSWIAALPDTGEPVAVLGACNVWPGYWSCFMMTTDKFPQIGFPLTKFAKNRMIPLLMELGGWRGEARSMVSHTEAHRWLEALGAKRESTLKCYGKNGEDYFNYVWTRNDVYAQGSQPT
jgi:hypothetical protein